MVQITVTDESAREFAKLLAPYVAQELRRTGAAPELAASEEMGQSAEIVSAYGDDTCREFVSALGETVLENAAIFFRALRTDKTIGSLELAELLGVASPRNLPSILTTPLKRRARALGLPVPWNTSADADDRTVWRSPPDVVRRMQRAINAELRSRELSAAS
jgi:hypothetical protein